MICLEFAWDVFRFADISWIFWEVARICLGSAGAYWDLLVFAGVSLYELTLAGYLLLFAWDLLGFAASKLLRFAWDLLGLAEVFWDLLGFAQIFRYLLTFAADLLGFTGVRWDLSVFSEIC